MTEPACQIDADGFCTTHGWDCMDYQLHVADTSPMPIDWSTHEAVLAALGHGDPLNDEQRQMLNILVDPDLDPDDTAELEDLVDQFSMFGSEPREIEDVARRLEMHHQGQEPDSLDCWWFYYVPDGDGGWYEVGSRVKDMLHVTQGEDGKYLYGARYGLEGLRAAINAAETIEATWVSARTKIRDLGLLTPQED